jgi:hypothetical protein
MTTESDTVSAQAELDRLGIAVPAGDIPFLQRTLLRQRELLRSQGARLLPETEPAHVFKPLAPAGDAKSKVQP